MKRSVRRIITHSFCGVLIKTQRANLSLLVLACLVSSTVTIAELAKNFLTNERVAKDTNFKKVI